MALSSCGLRHHPFTVVSWVRIPQGSPNAAIAQLVEQLTCRNCNFTGKPVLKNSAKSGKSKKGYFYENPELEEKSSSVETLHGTPTSEEDMEKRKSGLQCESNVVENQ